MRERAWRILLLLLLVAAGPAVAEVPAYEPAFLLAEGEALPGTDALLVRIEGAPSIGPPLTRDGAPTLTLEARVRFAGEERDRAAVLTTGPGGTVFHAVAGRPVRLAEGGETTCRGGFFSPVVGPAGHVAFAGRALEEPYRKGIYLAAPGEPAALCFVEGDAVLGRAIEAIAATPRLSGRGDLLLRGRTVDADPGFLPTLLVRPAPGGEPPWFVLAGPGADAVEGPFAEVAMTLGNVPSTQRQAQFADAGTVFLAAETGSGSPHPDARGRAGRGVLLRVHPDGGPPRIVAEEGSPVIQPDGRRDAQLRLGTRTPSVVVSPGGAAAFVADIVRSADAAASAGGERVLIVAEGDRLFAAPIDTPAVTRLFQVVDADDRRVVVGEAWFGEDHREGVLLAGIDREPVVLAVEGEPAPGDGYFQENTDRPGSVFSEPALRGRRVFFRAELAAIGGLPGTPGAIDRGEGVFVCDAYGTAGEADAPGVCVLRSGDAFAGGVLERIDGFGLLNRENAVDERGRMAFTWTLRSGRRGIALLAPAEAPDPRTAADPG